MLSNSQVKELTRLDKKMSAAIQLQRDIADKMSAVIGLDSASLENLYQARDTQSEMNMFTLRLAHRIVLLERQ